MYEKNNRKRGHYHGGQIKQNSFFGTCAKLLQKYYIKMFNAVNKTNIKYSKMLQWFKIITLL